MTHTPTREELELAALACGKKIDGWYNGVPMMICGGVTAWRPHLDAGDLLQMMLAADIDFRFYGSGSGSRTFANIPTCIAYAAGDLEEHVIYSGKMEDKQAALAEAAIKVVAQVGAKVRLEPRCTSCDGSGEVHRADGEWLGSCDCAKMRGGV